MAISDVLIIGGGIIGVSVAYALSKRRIGVTLIEGGHIGSGTTGATVAWVNSNSKTPKPYHDLNVSGMKAHKALAESLGGNWLHDGGCLEIRTGHEARAKLKEKVKRLEGWGYRSQVLDERELAQLEPDLAIERDPDMTIGYYPDEGWLDPVLYTAGLLSEARRAGAIVHTGVSVSEIVIEGNRATGAVLSDGRTLGAGAIINCCGAQINDVLPDGVDPLPMATTPGFLAFTAPAPVSLSRIAIIDGLEIRPDGAGRILIHEHDIDASLPDGKLSPDSWPAQKLLKRAQQHIPGLDGVQIEAVRRPQRPIPGDGLPAIGPYSDIDGFYVAVTHSGITLAPHLSELIARDLTESGGAEPLEAFRPDRLSTNLAEA